MLLERCRVAHLLTQVLRSRGLCQISWHFAQDPFYRTTTTLFGQSILGRESIAQKLGERIVTRRQRIAQEKELTTQQLMRDFHTPDLPVCLGWTRFQADSQFRCSTVDKLRHALAARIELDHRRLAKRSDPVLDELLPEGSRGRLGVGHRNMVT